MPELSVRFTSDEKQADSPIQVSLHRIDGGNAAGPVAFSPPLDDKALAELRWYLEEYWDWPVGPIIRQRAAGIEAQLEDWGRALLASMVTTPEAGILWKEFATDAGAGGLLTIDATDPRVLRLPWELLADEGGHLFAHGIGVRRRLRKTERTTIRPLDLPVRVLVVTSRPDGAGFVDPRAPSEPLLDALDELGAQVTTEFLYPPTLKALDDRLRDRKAPPVHMVHFDGHGVYDGVHGLGYLLFEADDHQKDAVDAHRLGTLLNRCGIPLMLLSACQSAKQDETNPYASVAARLVRAGVGSVLAMNYSVLVVAARKFVGAFYGGLVDGCTVGEAADEGRRALFVDPRRHSVTGVTKDGEPVEVPVRLHDWFLPALYQQSADPVVFAPRPDAAPATPRVWPRALTEPGVPGGLPIKPRHGFHGRARELLQLERAFAGRRVIVLHGFGGIGKTALAAEAGRWFWRTGRFPGGAAFVSFEGGGALSTLCSWAGQAVSGDPNFMLGLADPANPNAPGPRPRGPVAAAGMADPGDGVGEQTSDANAPGPRPRGPVAAAGMADPGDGVGEQTAEANAPGPRPRGPGSAAGIADPGDGVGEQTSEAVARVARLLAERPAVVILDNFESVLGKEPLMPPDELRAVLDAVWQWSRAGGSRVLITTRDTTFNDPRFAPSADCAHLELGGLAGSDTLQLAAAVLDHHGIDRARVQRGALVELMDRLGNHPLSLYLVLPHLGRHTVEELTADFEALLPGFTQGKAKERDESLAVSLEFSLRRLGEATRAALPALGVFQGGAFEDNLLAITEIDPDLWQTARAELEAAALITVERLEGVEPPFLRFHPTLAPYLGRLLPEERRAALGTRYWQRYYALSGYLYREDTPHPYQARAIAVRELPNLRRAFDLCLAAGAVDEAVDFAGQVGKFLDDFGRRRERDALLARLPATHKGGALTKPAFLALSGRGEALLQAGRAAEAEALFRDLAARIDAGASYDAAYDGALTLRDLARCREGQGRPGEAISFLKQAQDAFAALSVTLVSAKVMLGRVYVDLGDNLTALGQFEGAQQAYEQGLEILQAMRDTRNVGAALAQLGALALACGHLDAAAGRYREALATFRALGEPASEAIAWHQLGRVAQERCNWSEAERCYREALRIREQIGDLALLATTCNQLANVARRAGRPGEAEGWYLRAQEIKDQVSPHNASTLGNLAGLYLAQGRLDEAERYARRAAATKATLDLSAEPWKNYCILAQIAAARGQKDEAAAWRRQEQDTFFAYAGAAHQLPQWAPSFVAGVVRAVHGDPGARAEVERVLPQLEATKDWRNLAVVTRRILSGERDFEALRGELDYQGAYIVRAILAALTGEPVEMPTPPAQLPGWAPGFISAAAAAIQGNTDGQHDVEQALPELEQAGWQNLCRAVRAVLAGERDTAQLLPGLDTEDTAIVRAILAAMTGEPVDMPTPQPTTGGGPAAAPSDEQGITPEQLIEWVGTAGRPDAPAGLAAQLHALTGHIAADPRTPDELRALGRVLHAVLSGESSPDLAGLPPEWAEAVGRVVGKK